MTEELIKKVVADFEDAIKIMVRDKSNLHVFDIGYAPTEAGSKELWSMLIIFAPTKIIEAMRVPLLDSKPLAKDMTQ